jgi:putative FmdB family regulatory protein
MGGFYRMPIYEYECTKCGNIEEALQKFSDKPLTRCGHCKGKLTKLVSQSTFHLKGSGWYVTDYANKPKDSDKPSKKDSDKPSKKEKQSKSAESKTSGNGSDNKKVVSEKSA